MNRLLARISTVSLLLAGGAALAATVPPSPQTPTENTVDTIQGTQVADSYRWLETASDPKVQAWSDAQNAYARASLDKLPHAEAIRKRVTEIMSAKTVTYSGLSYRRGKLFAIVRQPDSVERKL